MARGLFLPVVGPSGCGKDTLMAGARVFLPPDAGFVFVRRDVTRVPGASGEDHAGLTEDEFARRCEAGGYALAWSAHGLRYGIPSAIELELSAGRHVVANISRTVLDEARLRFHPMRVLAVRVPIGLLQERLLARGREVGQDLAARLARAEAYPVEGPDVVAFDNDAPIPVSVSRFAALIAELAERHGNRSSTVNGASGAL